MRAYRIKTPSGVYAGSAVKIDRFGDLKPAGFAPTKSVLLARVYSENETQKMTDDMVRLAEFVRVSVNSLYLERIA
jgi:hypothetical protein